MARKRPRPSTANHDESPDAAAPPRIIGGSLRGRRFTYQLDRRTRPMKARVREAVFNLLGPGVKGKHAIDLFAGTGALGFEAISRGAATALLVERHFPTAQIMKKNAEALGIAEKCTVLPANTLLWSKRMPPLPAEPWIVFCSPPYDFYAERRDELLALINQLVQNAPPSSMFAVEADERFDFSLLPHADQWDVRAYPPAIVGIYDKP